MSDVLIGIREQFTPDQIDGPFTIYRLEDTPQDNQVRLYITEADEDGKQACIMYTYEPQSAGVVRQLEVPARCIFVDGYLVVLEQEAQAQQEAQDLRMYYKDTPPYDV
jgi:hypothetical protein